jgi:hypothetical protein
VESVEDFSAALMEALAVAFLAPSTRDRMVLKGLKRVEGNSMDTLVLDIVYRDLRDGQTHRNRVAHIGGLLASMESNVDSLAGLLADDCYEQLVSDPG